MKKETERGRGERERESDKRMQRKSDEEMVEIKRERERKLGSARSDSLLIMRNNVSPNFIKFCINTNPRCYVIEVYREFIVSFKNIHFNVIHAK